MSLKKNLCQKQGILGNCIGDVILRQNQVTIISYCHTCDKEVLRYLLYKFQVNTVKTTKVITNSTGLIGLNF